MNMMATFKGMSLLAVLCLTSSCDTQQAPAINSVATQEPASGAAPEPVTAEPAAVALALAPYEATANLQPGGNCSLDAINGGAVSGTSVPAGTEVLFGGWIGDAGNQVPSDARLIFQSDQSAYFVPLAAGGERPDVATALAADSLRNSGYNVLARLDATPGTYELSIVHGPVGAATSCPLNASLIITD